MLKLEQIILPINYNDEHILASIKSALNIDTKNIKDFKILKLSIDARKKPHIKYIASLGVSLIANLEKNYPDLKFVEENLDLEYEQLKTEKKVIVVGFGPAGMFASLALARMGVKPIIVEQGKQVEKRQQDVENFWNNRELNPYSNVQFGEGGAGTFSDGKLNSNLNNIYCKKVVNELYKFGAPKEITYINKPHIGSDNLKTVVKNIREEIKRLGGTFMFSTKLENIIIENNSVEGAVLKNVETNQLTKISADIIILCVGHSARETFEMLHEHNVNLQQKPFAMGVRIEQKQKDINLSQYGIEKIEGLPNADYKLVTHLDNGRSVFTFCMCPGGEVVASSSNYGEVVTNGMSYFARDKENANSALLVNVLPSDYGSSHPLAGIYFQREYEQKAFRLGGGNYSAPAQTVAGFLGKKNNKTSIKPSYKPSLTFCDIKECLPEFVTESLKMAITLLNKKLKNFAKDENLLIAIESRSSCPLTIVRDELRESNIKNLYPVGEGAGYAGGIMSSAQDGIKTAEIIYNKLKNCL